MSFHPENIKLTGTQAAGLLVMVLLVAFPPVLFFWSHVSFGANPLTTLTLLGALGGSLAALFLNWPDNKSLSVLAGSLSGAGAQLGVIALSQWSHEAMRFKVVVFLALILGAVPGYALHRCGKPLKVLEHRRS